MKKNYAKWILAAMIISAAAIYPISASDFMRADCASDCVEGCSDDCPNDSECYNRCLNRCLEGCNLPDVPEPPAPSPSEPTKQSAASIDN